MSWALVASSAIEDQPGSIMAASEDIVAILKEDDHADYLTIFPDAPGIFVWVGTVEPSVDGIECVEKSCVPAGEATIDYYMEQNGKPG